MRHSLVLAAAVFAGCAWLVPDREREYLTVSELAPLRLPTATDSSGLPSLPEALPEPPPSTPSLPATAPYLKLDQPFAQAWVSVLKALNLLRLELVRQDLNQGSLEFFYTPQEAELAEDKGLKEDLLYFFTGTGKVRELRYRLQLVPQDHTTQVYLLDPEGNPPQTSETSLKLLKLLEQTLTPYELSGATSRP